MKRTIVLGLLGAGLLGAGLLATPASAHGTCRPEVATRPFKDHGFVVGTGRVTCSANHDIQVTTVLQRRRANGTWENRASLTNQGFNTTSVSATASTACQSGTWRVLVDGFSNHHPSLAEVTHQGVTVSC